MRVARWQGRGLHLLPQPSLPVRKRREPKYHPEDSGATLHTSSSARPTHRLRPCTHRPLPTTPAGPAHHAFCLLPAPGPPQSSAHLEKAAPFRSSTTRAFAPPASDVPDTFSFSAPPLLNRPSQSLSNWPACPTVSPWLSPCNGPCTPSAASPLPPPGAGAVSPGWGWGPAWAPAVTTPRHAACQSRGAPGGGGGG